MATLTYLSYLAGFQQKTVAVVAHLATENEQMRFTDEAMLRSKTNYERPGITQEQVDWVKAIGNDYGMPEKLLYAMARKEKGRRGIMLGANFIDGEIRARYPPLMWNLAKAAKTWNQHLNRMVTTDPYVFHRTLWGFAKQWNPEPRQWVDEVLLNYDDARGSKGLEVTEPPKPRPTKTVGKTAAKAAKANGGARKSSKTHLHKEKR